MPDSHRKPPARRGLSDQDKGLILLVAIVIGLSLAISGVASLAGYLER